MSSSKSDSQALDTVEIAKQKFPCHVKLISINYISYFQSITYRETKFASRTDAFSLGKYSDTFLAETNFGGLKGSMQKSRKTKFGGVHNEHAVILLEDVAILS